MGRKALDRAGVDSRLFSGHSFWSGAATTAAAKRGMGDATIKLLGRWKSNTYQLYIKTPREQLAVPSANIHHPCNRHTYHMIHKCVSLCEDKMIIMHGIMRGEWEEWSWGRWVDWAKFIWRV